MKVRMPHSTRARHTARMESNTVEDAYSARGVSNEAVVAIVMLRESLSSGS